MLADKYESVAFWTTTEATDAINEALLFWNSLTGYWGDDQTITTTANSFEYALDPGTLMFGTRVMYNTRPLSFAALHDMDNGKPGWQTQTTADTGMPSTPQIWLPISIDLIAIWPAHAAGGGTLLVEGVADTPRLSAGGDYIDISEDLLNVILGYALHVLTFKEGGQRFGNTQSFFTDFLKEAAEENSQLMSSSLYRQFIGIDQRRQAAPSRGMPTDYDRFGSREP